VRIIAKSTLKAHPRVRGAVLRAVEDWHQVASLAAWANPNAVKATYGNASIIRDDRVVFNLCGNAYRLVVRMDYTRGTVFILWFGTHAEYDRIDAATITFRKATP
jgi:mRNA interferase HigB